MPRKLLHQKVEHVIMHAQRSAPDIKHKNKMMPLQNWALQSSPCHIPTQLTHMIEARCISPMSPYLCVNFILGHVSYRQLVQFPSGNSSPSPSPSPSPYPPPTMSPLAPVSSMFFLFISLTPHQCIQPCNLICWNSLPIMAWIGAEFRRIHVHWQLQAN